MVGKNYMDEFFDDYFDEEDNNLQQQPKSMEVDDFFDDYFDEDATEESIKEALEDSSEDTVEDTSRVIAEESLEIDDFFDDYFSEETDEDTSRDTLKVTAEDALEDKNRFLEEMQSDEIEGEIEWSEKARNLGIRNSLDDSISFNSLLVRENIAIEIPTPTKESSKAAPKETQKERVERLIKKAQPKKRYKTPRKPVPIKVPWKMDFYGTPPTEKAPVIVNPIKDINEDFVTGLELGEITNKDYELLIEYEKRLAERKAQRDIVEDYKRHSKIIAPSVPKSKRVGIGPLDNEIAMNMPCTEDGRTLSDLLAERNSDLVGTNYVDENLLEKDELLKKAAEKEIFKEKDYDIDRYKRIIEKEEGKIALRASRELLATERNNYRKKSKYNVEYREGVSEFTPEERLLADTLGVAPKKLTKLMGSDSKLSRRQRDKLLGIGVVKRTSYFGKDKETKIDTTFYDRNVLGFLKIFKYSTLGILCNIDGLDEITMEGTLQRMKKNGLIANETVPGVGAIWFLTRTGGAFVDYQMAYVTKKKFPSLTSIEPAIGVGYIASFLWNNRFNVLNLDDFPYHGKIVNGEIVKGETLVSESQIKSSMYKFFYNEDGNKVATGGAKGEFTKYVALKGEELWRSWQLKGGPSPETIPGNEFLYGVIPRDPRTSLYHLPDLVIQRPRFEDGSPGSIAIEVEKKQSSVKEYYKVMLAYKLDNRLYDKVIWVTNSSYNAKLINLGAKRAGMRPKIDYDIIPFITPQGGVLVDRFWKLGVKTW